MTRKRRPTTTAELDAPNVQGDVELPPFNPEAERSRLEYRQQQERLDRIYQQLLSQARATCRPILRSTQLDTPEEWDAVVLKGSTDFRRARL